MTEYFCHGCLEGWRNGIFMEKCSTCQKMANDENWTMQRVLEVWEPIVSYCNEHKLKAWVISNNKYMARLPYKNKHLQWLPTGTDNFSKQ